MRLQGSIQEVAKLILETLSTVALTGAGISVDSGVPDFRSGGGLWEKFDPMEYATIEAFRYHPEKVWEMFFDVCDLIGTVKPNEGHKALGELEKLGLLTGTITQNIDNLHQLGGVTKVVEYHGNAQELQCLECGYTVSGDRGTVIRPNPPACQTCGAILKPRVILFGEMIPADAMRHADELARASDVLLVIGTSAQVSPVNNIPVIARAGGAKIVEINLNKTQLTNNVTDYFLKGSSTIILPKLVQAIKDLKKNI